MKKLEIDQMSVVAGGGTSEVVQVLCGAGAVVVLATMGWVPFIGGVIVMALCTGDTRRVG
jgi:hypothetical protein